VSPRRRPTSATTRAMTARSSASSSATAWSPC